MYFAIIIVLLIIIIYLLLRPKVKQEETKSSTPPPPAESFRDWNDILMEGSIEKGIIDSHANYIKNVRQFSSGANFASVTDDNTSPAFTNYMGFTRPRYIEEDDTARQVLSEDVEINKRNKHMTFV